MAQVVTRFPGTGTPVSNKRINLWNASLYVTYLGPISNVAILVLKGVSYPLKGQIFVLLGLLQYKGGFFKNALVRNMMISADATGLHFVGTLYIPTLSRPNKPVDTIINYPKGASGAGFKAQL